MERIIGTLTAKRTLIGTLTGIRQLQGGLTVPRVVETPAFAGAYEYTPTSEEQTVEINGLRATRNITINPIPQNYGLITWNGSIITVS